ncbi:hypothetical protein GWK47_019059 [Chionoecetes opilio]|uniref:Uncharacterized protein n=1 Tax=Chionoecetes opilio TaxID=41210 RepID=A0A8J5CG36_CHIOP|nr:hypothetical protein GWK47_019059 [Chionoecetes opilio]
MQHLSCRDQSSDTDRIKDKSLKNLSRADATSTMNTFDKTSDSDSNTKKDKARHIIKTAKSTDISENVKNGAELTPETSLKINSPKQKTSDVRESDQKAPTQPHNNGSTSKDARVHKDEHKNLTRTSGRQRAMSSTDMVVRLADALEGILRSEDNMHHTLSASTRECKPRGGNREK